MAGGFAVGTAPFLTSWCVVGPKKLCSGQGWWVGVIMVVGGAEALEAGARGLGACRELQEDEAGHDERGARLRAGT